MNKEEKEEKEKIQRTTFVLGIFSASIIGFVLNIYANVYYDVYVAGKEQFSNFSQFSIVLPFLILILVVAFLHFLIYDYQNEINLNRPFLKRFFDYFDNVFWFTQITKRVNKIFWFIMKWIFVITFAFSIFNTFGWIASGIWIIVFLVWPLGKSIYQRHYGK